MGHKTLIGGTSYDVSGGKTLVSGTSYSVQGGEVLVNGTAYDISFFLPPAALDLWSGSSNQNEIMCIAYANGYWVVGGKYYDGSKTYARIAYTKSIDGAWTTRDLWYTTVTYGNKVQINCITYANGYWVVGGGHSVVNQGYSTDYARIGFATSLEGTWRTYDIWVGNSSNECINDIAYGDGYWGVVGYYYNGTNVLARVAKSTNLDGSWTMVTAPFNQSYGCYNSYLTYTNGYWVVAATYQNYMNMEAIIAYTTSLGGSWSMKTLWSGSGTTTEFAIHGVVYADGYWVAAGVKQNSVVIAYSTSISGTWTTKTIWSTNSTGYCTSLTYANGYWAISGRYRDGSSIYARIAYVTSPDGTWTIKDLWESGSTSYSTVANVIAHAGDYWIAGGQLYNNSIYNAHLEYSPSLDGFDKI